MEYTAETMDHNGLTIKIIADEDAPNPRKEWDNAGTMVCFHGRYDLGDEHDYKSDDYSGWGELAKAIEEHEGPLAVILPLRLYDHSGISMSVGRGAHPFDPGGWDSGQVGLIFITKKRAVEEWGKKFCTKKVIAAAEACLVCEVETYDQYLTGDVYGYTITDEDGEDLDSLWGCFGFQYCKSEAIAVAERLYKERAEDAISSAGDIHRRLADVRRRQRRR